MLKGSWGNEETRSCYHLGGGAGYRSELRLYPRLGYGIGVMGNETSYETGAITRMIISTYTKEPGAVQGAMKYDTRCQEA